ncbi:MULTISPECIES: hypothetical protein [unclassified Streptomyces]|uniref:hypothetical protein n=1 Tax=unclassified Streptomyces TaxID=2593676 RepID=UPI0006FC266A|nr:MULTISPECIES: hypothetical protein [unclassified Streptomyces]KQX59423.1 hypothetical protein ASD33_03860 [Streptomyces sp. Root1304]KRB00683.1 hypothetical protein ASE09_03860 [Streptomyces sp. Root66D1]
MSWPSVILFAPAVERAALEARVRAFGLVPDPVTGDEKLHWEGYSYYLDLSGGILSDYEPDELAELAARIGEPYGVYVSCQSMDAARTFLRSALDGFDGLIDTNHFDVLRAGEFLALLDRHPDWDWRRHPSTDLG